MQHSSIMVVDYDFGTQEKLKAILSGEGFEVKAVSTAAEAIESFKSNPCHLVIIDLDLPDRSGMDVLSDLKNLSFSTPVLILSSDSTIDIAVDAMRRGASDFFLKPFLNESIVLSVINNIKGNNCKGFKKEKSHVDSEFWEGKKIITRSEKMYALLEQAKQIANSDAAVLIQGESGTGKELLAAYIVCHSGREKKSYVAMNCAALPENLVESELFGHEKGAFTGAFQKKIGKFEQASSGTLLLDEISELSLAVQAKLLRVLQEKVVDRLGGGQSVAIDTRIIATCNVDLQKAVKDGRFREDLFYRVNVIPLVIPPLRERKEDILLLTEYFISKCSIRNNKNIKKISPDAVDCLCSYNWPGNVRELENVIERSVLICDGPLILSKNLFFQNSTFFQESENDFSVGTTVKEMEKKLIFKTLKHVNDNRTHAAQILGISIRTLRNKLKEYSIDN